ncbi:MAG: sigma factor-like helix-turn-helix DNA-binding protein [Blastocatellia bacterium]|nr:sigma factor-like helix-turn-helix DNA-binding protein [Blastocatellia bacterium]
MKSVLRNACFVNSQITIVNSRSPAETCWQSSNWQPMLSSYFNPKEDSTMPADRLVMRQIKDILRLRYDARLSLREIARSLNISVGVISKYLQLAADAGIGWPPPADLVECAGLPTRRED